MTEWIAKLFEHRELTRMGHGQRAADANLGLGWVYYGLARSLRPRVAVVIGSYRGFVPLVLGKALHDNAEGGEVWFIDPSLVDDFWADADAVRRYFAGFGVTNVRHFRMTTQEFVEAPANRTLERVGLLFVDGYHTAAQARFDYEAFRARLGGDGVALFHDTARTRTSRLYGAGREYTYTHGEFLADLRADPGVQAFDLPLFDGVTLVRKVGG